VAEGTKPKKSADDDDRTQQVDQREIRALMNKTFGNVSTTPPPAGDNEETVVGPKAAGVPSEPKLAKADAQAEPKASEPETKPLLDKKADDDKRSEAASAEETAVAKAGAEEAVAAKADAEEAPTASEGSDAKEAAAAQETEPATPESKPAAATKSGDAAPAAQEPPRMGLTLVLVAIAVAALIWAVAKG
jgi:hypothetical protein